MWSSFIDQIQQRLDDAADLLGDEEAEEVEIESHAQYPSELPKVAPLGSSSALPPALTAVPSIGTGAADVDGDGEGWDDDDVDNLLPTASDTPSAPVAFHEDAAELPPPPANCSTPVVASTAAALVAELSIPRNGQTQGLELPSGANEAAKETPQDAAEAASAAEASDSLCANSQEASEVLGAVAAGEERDAFSALPIAVVPPLLTGDKQGASSGEVRLSAAPPVESAGAGDPIGTIAVTPLAAAAAAAGTNTASEPALAEKLEGPQEDTQEPSEATSVAAQHTDAAEERLPQSAKSGAQEAVLTAPLPLTAPTAKASGDEAQLLRFQQLLAEEMESVASLQKENSVLKGRVSVLEGELATASARLASTANSEEQISMLIEKLGKEKERHKAAASERSELEEHVQDLEEELEEYRVKEQRWIGGSEQQRQNESAAQQRIAQLEKELRARDSLTEELNVRVREAAHQNGVLQHRVEELTASYSTQLNAVKESNSDTVDQLRREVEQLRSSLQNITAEYDTRTAELEREVQQSTLRAHQAETRFSEVEFGSVSTLQDLRSELEDSQRSIATWKAEAQKARSEYVELLDQYAFLKRSRTAAEADLRERIASDASATAELRKGLREWETRYQALQETLRAAQAESEEQKKAIMVLEVANQKLKMVTADSFNRSHSEASLGSLAPTKGASLDGSLSSSPLLGRPAVRAAAAGVPMNPFTHRERTSWGDSTDRKTRERLEQEVLRQSAELEGLRHVAGEAAEWKRKFGQLQTEHDLLLQLYGQLEDDVRALKREKAAPVVALPPTPAPAAAVSDVSPSTPL